ncbi:phosphoglycerate mutase-like protein [Terfezia boudieri ATCC MYA-4762]|uniref:Phosphoglycerate mutase-like protein n=1 Tax=Terfezia boudieri ATCC MYA-4762 TaxID=1051890 RepID=A0A3N4LCM7_9PEZI|nr:phosphoglycerate mutase-like protein [Terfezia boudieri ATCC MYA-4762]
MGKPRLIILVRHAQSEGNKNRAVHQTTPDHRVKLTHQGHKQAKEAGQRLLGMLRPDDTLQFYTSPYLRTRETTTGMLSELSEHPNYNKIKIYEEPRLREQDFGNFQPCSAEMERIWHERAAYGHFFYRIPNGESAADAYDRVSGFNETLWRQFADDDCASVLVLVTHGLMTRIFLMKWYHYSVEYFEDLRNVNHCEFITMERNESTGKYILQNELRTWSSYKKEQEARRQAAVSADDQSVVKDTTPLLYGKEEHSVQLPRRWGGCVNGCNHARYKWYTYGEPNTNNPNGDDYGKSGKHTPADETKCLMQHVQDRIRERLEVLGAGRDFGGSKSGAGSDAEDDTGSLSGSGGEDDFLEQVRKRLHDRPVEVSISATDGPNQPGEVDGVEGDVALVSSRLSVPPNTAVSAIEVRETI